jgi:hypothetical protein
MINFIELMLNRYDLTVNCEHSVQAGVVLLLLLQPESTRTVQRSAASAAAAVGNAGHEAATVTASQWSSSLVLSTMS